MDNETKTNLKSSYLKRRLIFDLGTKITPKIDVQSFEVLYFCDKSHNTKINQ